MIEIKSIKQPKELWEIFQAEGVGHITSFKNIVEEKKSALSEEEHKKLSTRLHRLKGSLGFIGFIDLAKKVDNCEGLLKQNSQETINQLSQILVELEQLLGEISKVLNTK